LGPWREPHAALLARADRAVRRHEAARAIEPLLAVPVVLLADLDARGLACAARARRANAAAPAHFRPTGAGAAAARTTAHAARAR
jgi:hypothetical protein